MMHRHIDHMVTPAAAAISKVLSNTFFWSHRLILYQVFASPQLFSACSQCTCGTRVTTGRLLHTTFVMSSFFSFPRHVGTDLKPNLIPWTATPLHTFCDFCTFLGFPELFLILSREYSGLSHIE